MLGRVLNGFKTLRASCVEAISQQNNNVCGVSHLYGARGRPISGTNVNVSGGHSENEDSNLSGEHSSGGGHRSVGGHWSGGGHGHPQDSRLLMYAALEFEEKWQRTVKKKNQLIQDYLRKYQLSNLVKFPDLIDGCVTHLEQLQLSQENLLSTVELGTELNPSSLSTTKIDLLSTDDTELNPSSISTTKIDLLSTDDTELNPSSLSTTKIDLLSTDGTELGLLSYLNTNEEKELEAEQNSVVQSLKDLLHAFKKNQLIEDIVLLVCDMSLIADGATSQQCNMVIPRLNKLLGLKD